MKLHWRPTDRRDRDGGYALIDAVSGMLVLAMIAAVALPAPSRAPGVADLTSISREVAAILRFDRARAMQDGRTQVTVVDPVSRMVSSGSGARHVALPQGVELQLAANAAGIGFDRDGRSVGGQIQLSSAAAAYIVDVAPITGAVSIRRME
ncbi:hypothetical protein PZ895_05890 [Mesorhizobium sp. YIM 152430]|uniref:pilus assembly FimT family protein n=1 Tax=Mesorhizobium sp. YIM 152430 TaxID=3031761 RepID=UPI0023DC2828|nr:hypothetical protein [Mesorhizobium sp. YIM 152430]MDF1599307.1 hypothetical protein [Mesorhizobium sp. YIM 152430]